MRVNGQKRIHSVAVFAAAIVLSLSVTGCGEDPRFTRAERFEQAGEMVAANTIYKTLLRENPRQLHALRSLAANLALMGRHDEALAYQERVVTIDTADVQTRIELAFNYLNHRNAPQMAVKRLHEAAQLEGIPKNKTFLAQALAAAGREDEAVELLRQVVRENPDYVHAWQVLSRLESAAGSGSRGSLHAILSLCKELVLPGASI